MRDSPDISAFGVNKFKFGFFGKNLDDHWRGGGSDHSHQYPGYTKAQYAQEALDLIQSATSHTIKGYKNKSGQIVRYDAIKNNFAKGHPDIGIATMFKPTGHADYFERRKEYEAIKEE